MAIIKCKMCGGDLELVPDATVCECEYCGTRQTVPAADDEKKLKLFERANRLRRACEFDKAAGVYESIVADFDTEAEAYWGLVLCRFGIEYVDDPATGKKVPTCHRAGFESVEDDPNFEQACENADAVARRVYREEGRAIDALRERIIEVSGKEAPYDVFISYKELADSGERTEDSVLAQDIYDALTAKGYRVFFSRITLEDKLGVEYEPYIFAALNSAKVMLLVGTDYENLNAVWVRNEWSRYLALMTQHKDKVLIPCYKDMDPYDLPKEVRKLAAQDMGKVGAMQDLLRGVEKILPLKKAEPAAAPQPVVVSGGPNVTALQKRGFMALEDGRWDAAREFFNQVLNMDAENAEAYLGLALAGRECRNEAEYVRRRASRSGAVEKKTIPAARDRIEAAAKENAVKGYLSGDEIVALFQPYDLSYPSTVKGTEALVRQEREELEQNRDFSRAFQFASGETAERLRQMRDSLMDSLEQKLEQAKAQEAVAKAEKERAYEAHLQAAEKKAAALRAAAEEVRETNYQSACMAQAEAQTIDQYRAVTDSLRALGNYKDSPARLEQCMAAVAEEAERRRAERQEAAKKRRKKIKKTLIITGIVAVLAVAAVLVVTKIVIPNSNYNKAVALMEDEKYDEALDAFAALDGYKDSDEKIREIAQLLTEAARQDAEALAKAGDKAAAAITFGKLGTDDPELLETSMALWEEVAPHQTVSAGNAHSVCLLNSGRVAAVGYDKDGRCDVTDRKDIVSVSAGLKATVGLRADGTVVAVGNNYHGQCDVSDWTDVVAVSMGGAHTVGLRADGTVVSAGNNEYGQRDVGDWTDIVAISAGNGHTVGLRTDGTVVAAGNDKYGQCDVSDWADIVAVFAGTGHTVGLRADGTVVAAGNNEYGQCDVSDWSDIVAVCAGDGHTVGLRADGTVVAVGYNEWGQCDVSDWTDIVAVSAGAGHTVGLRADGTVVAAGNNKYGQCDVSNWTDVKITKYIKFEEKDTEN